VLGAMLGAYLLGALRNAFILLELSPFLQQMSVGLVIVAAALFDQFRQGNFRYVQPFGLSFRRMGAERKRPE
jgi:ribose/xylose/arabinose/galactoside ABC-type transport system permease subunit